MGGLSELWKFWYDSIFGFRLRWGGAISSVVLLGLCVVGIGVLGRFGFSGMYFSVFPAVSSLLFLIGNEAIKSRLLFNVPLGLYAAYGFVWLSERCADYFEGTLKSFVVLNVAVYLFRSLANLVATSL